MDYMESNERDVQWQRFTQTGDPRQYLAYRQAVAIETAPTHRHHRRKPKPKHENL